MTEPPRLLTLAEARAVIRAKCEGEGSIYKAADAWDIPYSTLKEMLSKKKQGDGHEPTLSYHFAKRLGFRRVIHYEVIE